MKISTKGRYGLEALMVMCLDDEQGHVSLKKIAETLNISEAYIMQIFLVLRRAGIVESVRGAQGGYRLAKEQKEVTVGEVLHVLEGPLSPVACVTDGRGSKCDRMEVCPTRLLWQRVGGELNQLTRSITLAHLIDHYRSLNPRPIVEDYCI
jgi:Rrf2 family protein